MKKSILLAAVALPTLALGQFSETFDDYTSGDYICVVSENFYPWAAGTEGTDGDALDGNEKGLRALACFLVVAARSFTPANFLVAPALELPRNGY